MVIQEIENINLARGTGEDVEPLLEMQHVSFSYGSTPITKNVNFRIGKGEIRAIIGPNGAGKSTFLNLISGRNYPQQGEIVFNGKKITRMEPHKRRQLGISRSFQITNIFGSNTVYENIRLAVQGMMNARYHFWKPITSYSDVHRDTLKLIEECHLTEVMCTRANNLSYAQQRQVEIALSLANHPSLLLLDEPTAGLSVEESKWVANLVCNIAKNHHLSVIFIEHDMNIVFTISDFITVLHYGEIIVEDRPEKIRSNAKVQEIYLGE